MPDYTILVLYNALEAEFNCVACKFAELAYDKVVRSFGGLKRMRQQRVLFAKVSFKHAQEAFYSLGMYTAPQMMGYFRGRQGPVPYEMKSTTTLSADAMAHWISQLSGNPLTIRDDNDFLIMFGLSIVIIGLVSWAWLDWQSMRKHLLNQRSIAVILAIWLSFILGGIMFRRIKKVPYHSIGANASATMQKTIYFANMMSYALGAEVDIASCLYVAVAAVLIAMFSPNVPLASADNSASVQSKNSGKSTSSGLLSAFSLSGYLGKIIVGCGAFAVLVGLVQYCFHLKVPSYPYFIGLHSDYSNVKQQ